MSVMAEEEAVALARDLWGADAVVMRGLFDARWPDKRDLGVFVGRLSLLVGPPNYFPTYEAAFAAVHVDVATAGGCASHSYRK